MASINLKPVGDPLPRPEKSRSKPFRRYREDSFHLKTGVESEWVPGALEPGSFSEILPRTYRDRPAALGAAMALARQACDETESPVLWCQLREPERLHLHAPGLTAFGLDPARLLKLTVRSEKDLLWAMEEALASGALSAVVGILWHERFYNFTASKRLRMRAQRSNTPAILLRPHRANGCSASDQRFVIAGRPSRLQAPETTLRPRPGRPEWQIALTKSRTGLVPGTYAVRWNHETLRLDLAAGLAERTPVQARRVAAEPTTGLCRAG